MNKKLVIIDYSVTELHIFNYPREDDSEEEIFDFLSQYHNEQGSSFRPSQVHWMIVNMKNCEERLPLYIH